MSVCVCVCVCVRSQQLAKNLTFPFASAGSMHSVFFVVCDFASLSTNTTIELVAVAVCVLGKK